MVTRSLRGEPKSAGDRNLKTWFTGRILARKRISRIMKPKLLLVLSFSLVVVSLGRGQDPAGGGATGGVATENSHGSPAAQLMRIGPRPTFADLA